MKMRFRSWCFAFSRVGMRGQMGSFKAICILLAIIGFFSQKNRYFQPCKGMIRPLIDPKFQPWQCNAFIR